MEYVHVSGGVGAPSAIAPRFSVQPYARMLVFARSLGLDKLLRGATCQLVCWDSDLGWRYRSLSF